MLTYLLVLVGATLLTWLMLYIDKRLFDKTRSNKDYFKMIALVDVIVLCVLWFLKWIAPNGNIKDVISTDVPKIIGNTIKLPQINEEMLTGGADF